MEFRGDAVRYRTVKVFDEEIIKTHSNGDMFVFKKLLGRIVVVTVPMNEDNTEFMIDFAFCSPLDNFSREIGQDVAYTRLLDKIYNEPTAITTFKKSKDVPMIHYIRRILIDEYSHIIQWLNGVRADNIV